MPKRDDHTFADIVVQRYQESGFSRSEREEVWREARRRWEPSYIDTARVKRAPFVKTNIFYNGVETKVENLLAASTSNGRWVTAHSSEDKVGSAGIAVTELLDRAFSANIDSLERYARNGILKGNAAVRVEYFDNGEEDWGWRFELIDEFDQFPDWRHMRWMVVRRYMTVSRLGEMASVLSGADPIPIGMEGGEPVYDPQPMDGGRAARVFKKVLKAARDGELPPINEGYSAANWGQDKWSKAVGVGRDNDLAHSEFETPDDPLNTRIEVLEYHEFEHPKRVMTVLPNIGKGGEHLIFQEGRSPYNCAVVVPFIPNTVDGEYWGLSESEISGPAVDVADRMFRTQIRTGDRLGDPPLKYRRSSKIRRDFLRSPTGAAVDVQNMDDLEYLVAPSTQGGYQFLMDSAKRVADFASGDNDLRRGTPADVPATNANLAMQAGNTRDRRILRRWGIAVEGIARVVLEQARVHIDVTKSLQVLGPRGAQLVRLKPEFLKNPYMLKYAGSMSALPVGQEIQAMLNFAQAFPDVADRLALATQIAFKSGAPDPQSWVNQPVYQLPLDPEDENELMVDRGGVATIHPRDRHEEHIQQHGAVLQALPPDHPARPLVEAHMMDHAQAYNQQQMMQQAGGTLPRMQQGSGQQQIANEQAPGGSPGPETVGAGGNV